VSTKSFDVIAIGNAIVDVITRADEAFLDQHGMAKGSMQLIDEDTATALYADMPPGAESSGGSAANTAAGLAALGGRVGFVGRVRDDQLGTVTSSFTKGMISSIIPAQGVSLQHLRGFQLDLTAANGNSGGPVFSLQTGKVFGVLQGGAVHPDTAIRCKG